jgi:hypothetical protein
MLFFGEKMVVNFFFSKKNLINNAFLWKFYPQYPLQALSQTSFLYNKHSLLILLLYNLFILQLLMAKGWQQLLDGITQAFEDKATTDLVFVALLL